RARQVFGSRARGVPEALGGCRSPASPHESGSKGSAARQRIGPGWHARTPKSWPADPPGTSEAFAVVVREQTRSQRRFSVMLLGSFFRYLDFHGPRTRASGFRRRAAHAQLLLEPLEARPLPGFVAALSSDAGSGPISVAVGDFNGDGIPDLAAANLTGGTVSVLLGHGDGTFGAAVNYAAGGAPLSV